MSHNQTDIYNEAMEENNPMPTNKKKEAYTPGPWHIGMKPGPIVYDDKGGEIADCRSISNERNENGHNARLIAAAPELLEALKELKKWWNTPAHVRADWNELKKIMDAAIAKAESRA